MPGIHHLDLVVSDLERSLAFYRGLLQPLGYVREGPIVRERQSEAHGVPYDRYAVGVHHVAFAATSRSMVHERTAWLAEQGVTIESGPREYDYIPGYFAVFFYDPDGIKLEIVHVPDDPELAAMINDLHTRLARLEGR